MQTYHCIVLSTLRYKDNDLIIRAFSREIGLVSFIHKWLKEKGIDFKICSDRNPADKSIPRVEL